MSTIMEHDDQVIGAGGKSDDAKFADANVSDNEESDDHEDTALGDDEELEEPGIPGDDKESEQHKKSEKHNKLNISAKRVDCFELVYSCNGKSKSTKIFDEMRSVDGLDFVQLNMNSSSSMGYWLKNVAELTKLWKHEKKNGVQIFEGILQLKQLRNSASINRKVRGTALRAMSRPSYYLLKKYELRNELSELDGFVEIQVADETVRVIPRATRDNEPLWVCAEDIGTCVQYIKKQGISTSHAEEDLPKGIRRCKRKSGERFTVHVIENDTKKIHTVKSLQEAIELQQRHSTV